MRPLPLSERFRMVRLALCDPTRLTVAPTRESDTREGSSSMRHRDAGQPGRREYVDILVRDLQAALVVAQSLTRLTVATLPLIIAVSALATTILSGMPTGPQSDTAHPDCKTEP